MFGRCLADRPQPAKHGEKLHPYDEGLVQLGTALDKACAGRASHLLSTDGDAFSWTQGREPDHQIEASASRLHGHPVAKPAMPVL
jgi:hypothetical protein